MHFLFASFAQLLSLSRKKEQKENLLLFYLLIMRLLCITPSATLTETTNHATPVYNSLCNLNRKEDA